MSQMMSRLTETSYSAFRIVSGGLFGIHGWQKLVGGFGREAIALSENPQMFFGGVIELVGGLLILVGLFTRATAFLCSGMMAVAYFQFHFSGDQPLPIQNGGELAVVYCFAFLFMAAKGDGIASLGRLLFGAPKAPSAD